MLAQATTADGRTVAGTRDALVLDGRVLPWEQVQSADWDRDASVLRVAEVGTWGEPRTVHELAIDEPGRLLELTRERITASVVLQRHVPVVGRRGVFVVARRAPRGGDAPLTWVFDYEEGVDPEDAFVRAAAEVALTSAREELGLD